jgi:hypothetical protein
MTAEMEKVREAIARAVYTAIHIRRWDAAYPEDIAASYDQADAALRAILETHAIVPREPTEATDIAFWEWWSDDRGQLTWRPLYAAWVAAAPDPLKE